MTLIQPDQVLVGRPAVEVREMMCTLRDRAHTTLAFGERFSMDGESAAELVALLIENGLIEEETASRPFVNADEEEDTLAQGKVIIWTTTISGSALAKAKIGKPMDRLKAHELLDGAVARAGELNASPAWLHWVDELVLYGSLAGNGDGPVGDVDLGVRLEPRFEVDELMRRQQAMIEADGARPSSFAAISYAEGKLMKALRGRSSRIDLVQYGEQHPLPPGATARVVYRR
ncbi:MAG: hypothetical protein ACRD0U_00650 [Acidimicrobiales bacterium]